MQHDLSSLGTSPLSTTSIDGLHTISQVLRLTSQLFPNPLPSNPTVEQLQYRQMMLDGLTAMYRSAACSPSAIARHSRPLAAQEWIKSHFGAFWGWPIRSNLSSPPLELPAPCPISRTSSS